MLGHEVMFEMLGRGEAAEKAQKAYNEANEARKIWDKNNPHFSIEHEEAGLSFNHDCPHECAGNLERLRREGFIVPEYAISALREEDPTP